MKTTRLGLVAAMLLPSGIAQADLITYSSPNRELFTYVPPGGLSGPYGPAAGGEQRQADTSRGVFFNGWNTGLVYSPIPFPHPWDYGSAQAETGQLSWLNPGHLFVQGYGWGGTSPSFSPLPYEYHSFVDVWITLAQDTPYSFSGHLAALSITGGPSGPITEVRDSNGNSNQSGTLLAGTYHLHADVAPGGTEPASSHYTLSIPSPGSLALLGVVLTAGGRRRR